jgi:hypothetical protein
MTTKAFAALVVSVFAGTCAAALAYAGLWFYALLAVLAWYVVIDFDGPPPSATA